MASKRKAPSRGAEGADVKELLEKAVKKGKNAAGKAVESTAGAVKDAAGGAAKAVKKATEKVAEVPKAAAKAVLPSSAKDEGAGPSSKTPPLSRLPADLNKLVDPKRVMTLREGEVTGTGPVLYWMSRDQRSADNWALLYAIEQAHKQGSSVAVIFNLVPRFLHAGARHFGFMLRGLRVMEKNLKEKDIPFFIVQGEPVDTIVQFVAKVGTSLLVTDFSPLRIAREWKGGVCSLVNIPVHQVDAHNVVPTWVCSDKQEYGARTIRTKVHRNLPEFLVEYPELPSNPNKWALEPPAPIDWEALLKIVLSNKAVPEIDWAVPGEDAGMEWLLKRFLGKGIAKYDADRNDPTIPTGVSGMSPYLHYGNVAAQRAALEARKYRKSHPKAVDAFLEELIVRRELSDNYCYYQPNYDNLQGAFPWARESLQKHAADPREYVYTKEQLEKGQTYDELWNASQHEMVHHGKMHGFMRMYWAKKILEWTPSPEEALAIAIELNDKYEIDGRDPNGYVGCMWAIAGVHDQGWGERPIFGKIRYMNYAGCKRKFKVDKYVAYVNKLMSDLKTKGKSSAAREKKPV
ncbi:Deoxyribodipyrimidine photolyase/cryptochrome [Klebsormidium nitens]|uniref:Deoxyribodipyrimidine photo-lyase n=1 Tax=Klebsormidium nitens TaxID=105231 RepID=A0A1Y1HTJ0_KLENI|nr:Deoxyribodipyrimidine photolyase/cryptochrome [Klebsormidium nitens]|eukprot:GAQ81945.1 Deoxyribodipyrimidine photolyase/cryptochrome [Klebsormidium nitens]